MGVVGGSQKSSIILQSDLLGGFLGVRGGRSHASATLAVMGAEPGGRWWGWGETRPLQLASQVEEEESAAVRRTGVQGAWPPAFLSQVPLWTETTPPH